MGRHRRGDTLTRRAMPLIKRLEQQSARVSAAVYDIVAVTFM